MSSQPQRQGRHQRRASQSVFVLPENLATLEFDVVADVVGGTKLQADLIKKDGGGVAEQQQQVKLPVGPGRHRRAMSVSSVALSRVDDVELITEDIGSYKLGA